MKILRLLKGIVKFHMISRLEKRYTLSSVHHFSHILKVNDLIVCPETVVQPSFGPEVIVLSPHFDDDVIGCGGTLALHLREGGRVCIIYLSDGRDGNPEFEDRAALEKARKEEARAALQILGLNNSENIHFMDISRAQFEVNEKNLTDLLNLLQKYFRSPPYPPIMIPSFLDNHRDHLAANLLLKRMAPSLPPDVELYAYEIWTPLALNYLVDITKTAEIKRKALLCYETQLRYVAYERVAMALNMYRTAMTMNGQGYAEAFLKLPLRKYCDLF